MSWRVQADEYYGVTYNVYSGGSLITTGLTTSNYVHIGGSTSNTYTVAPVRNGVEGTQCAAVTPWAKQYLEIPMANVQSSNGTTIWTQSSGAVMDQGDYAINEVSLGDVDGDGKIDFIVKRLNQWDRNNLFPTDNWQFFAHIECYASSIGYGRLWWIDCGRNIVYGADEQFDAVAFDWNQDGKCEVLYRGGAGTVLHHSDGTTQTIGNASENIRGGVTHTANMTFSNSGEEWLMYIDGSTGKAFDVIEYPLPRGNASDWGDAYGHRSSKYFMGAPYLDGLNPYIFLGRGIYTKIEACVLHVTNGNKLEKIGNTWQSYNNAGWFGQGYHNFNIADVDEDGADEIVYGSMVLDYWSGNKNLHGASSTGLGHGDALHTGDLDPFRRGLETFACNEERPSFNFRNAATCEIYARSVGSGDDGRAMAGNFTNEYPGGIGMSTQSGVVPLSLVQTDPLAPTYISGMANNWNAQTPYPAALNFRIYWDGDLLSESINGPGSTEGYLFVDKLGRRIYDTGHGNYETACINSTKKNPCATGDIFGDWREEIVMRSSDNKTLRVYTTNTPTEYRMQSLWYDHQYRQAMVWQTEGYNQPPHPSFFVGEMEGFTAAPPAYTYEGRTMVNNSEHVTTAMNGKDVFIRTIGNTGSTVSPEVDRMTLDEGAQPSTLYLYARYRKQGNDKVAYDESVAEYSRIHLSGAALTGNTNVCKQGGSAARIPTATHTYTGKTDIWAGALVCTGNIENSPIWVNRFSELFIGSTQDGMGKCGNVEMEYGSQLYILNDDMSKYEFPSIADNGLSKATVESLYMKEGSRVIYDIDGVENATGDKLNIGTLTTRKQTSDAWKTYGPEYLKPVFEIKSATKLEPGDYLLGDLGNITAGSSLDDIIVEIPNGINARYSELYEKDRKYYLHVGDAKVGDALELNGKTFYLYNENLDKFLSRGKIYNNNAFDHNNDATSDDFGIPVVFEYTSGGYKLKSADNQLYYGGPNWMTDNNEEANGNTYIIDEVEGKDGYYTFTNANIITNNQLYIYTQAGTNQYRVATNAIIGDNCASVDNTYWRILTADERDAIINARSLKQQLAAAQRAQLDVTTLEDIVKYGVAVDCTDKVNNAELRTTTDGWTRTSSFALTYADNVGEAFNTAGALSQTVTGLSEGLYRVSISGFFREGTNANCVTYADYNMSNAYLEANGNKVQYADWAGERSGDTNPNDRAAAATLFDEGKYKNEVYAYVGADGNLTITIAQPTPVANSWLTFRDVKLERIEPIVFLFNEETGKFLSRGDAWGVRSMTDDFGVPVVLEAVGEGKYKLKSADHNNYYGDNAALYGDKAEGAATQFTIETTDGYSVFKNVANDGYMYVNTTENAVYADGNDAGAAVAKWTIMTAEQRNARIATFHDEVAQSVATAAGLNVNTYDGLKSLVAALNPKDVTTDLLGTDVLNGNYTGWTGSHWASNITAKSANNTFGVNNLAGGVQETYNRTTKITKTITAPGAGLYKVTVYGFYREGDQPIASDADMNLSNAFLDVNGKKVQWASQAAGTKPAPAECATAFTDENYENTVFVYLNEGENMNITIGQPGWTQNGWLTFYNASITKYEATSPSAGSDLTGLIINPQFNEGNTGWTITGSGSGRGQSFVVENTKDGTNTVATLWSIGTEERPQHLKPTTISQDITAPATGVYKLTVDAKADVEVEFFAYNKNTKEEVKLSVLDNQDGTRTLYFWAEKGHDVEIGVRHKNDDRITDTRQIVLDDFTLTFVGERIVTEIIKNPSFEEGTANWNGEPNVNETYKNAEFFNKNEVDLNQQLIAIPNGWYKVKVQGFYRDVNRNAATTNAMRALLTANTASEYIRLIGSEADTNPVGMVDAKNAFDADKYWNEVMVYVYDNQLMVGIDKQVGVANDWLMFDNFQLEYYRENTNDERTQYIKDPSFEVANADVYWDYAKNPSNDTKAAEVSNGTYTMTPADRNYLFNTWAPSASEYNVTQTLEGLPAGVYTLEVQVASDANNTIDVMVNNGHTEKEHSATTTNSKGESQLVRLEQIVVRENGDNLVIDLSSDTWFKADNFRLIKTADISDDVILKDAQDYLQHLIAEGNTEKAKYPLGPKMFDYKSNSVLEAFDNALRNAASSLPGALLPSVDAEIAKMLAANTTFAENAGSITYNGPAIDGRYNMTIADIPVTYLLDGVTVPFSFAKSNIDVNYMQSFILTETQPRSYTLSFQDAEGTTLYIAAAGEGDDRYVMTTTDDPKKAMSFGIERSADYAESDIVYLRNPLLANNYLNNLEGEFKTALSMTNNGTRGNFKLLLAEKATPTLKVTAAAGWSTLIAPFMVEVPAGVVAYTITGYDAPNNVLELAEVGENIPANTPVVLNNTTAEDVTEQLSGYGTASKDDYQTKNSYAYLVGRYSNEVLPVHDEHNKYYILQRPAANPFTAFYKISADRNATPYRCYLVVPAESENTVKGMLRLPSFYDDETSIDNVIERLNEASAIYDASGKRRTKIGKGINIVKFNDGSTQKILVK